MNNKNPIVSGLLFPNFAAKEFQIISGNSMFTFLQ